MAKKKKVPTKTISPALHAGSKQSPIATSPPKSAKEALRETKMIPNRKTQQA
jgi:hypothetical protein